MTKIRNIKYLAGSPWFSFFVYSFFLLFIWPFQTGKLSGLGLQCAGSHLEVVPEWNELLVVVFLLFLSCALGLVSPRFDIRRGGFLFDVTDEQCCKWAVLVCFLFHLLLCAGPSHTEILRWARYLPLWRAVLLCSASRSLSIVLTPWTLASSYRLSLCTVINLGGLPEVELSKRDLHTV